MEGAIEPDGQCAGPSVILATAGRRAGMSTISAGRMVGVPVRRACEIAEPSGL